MNTTTAPYSTVPESVSSEVLDRFLRAISHDLVGKDDIGYPALVRILGLLKPREASILMMHFGLATGSVEDSKAVAQAHDISRTRVGQITRIASDKVYAKIRKTQVVGDIDRPISDLDLHWHVFMKLVDSGISSVDQLVELTPPDLDDLNRHGERVNQFVKHVEKALAKCGLRLRDPREDDNRIESLLLTTRPQRALKRNGINTVDELCAKRASELLDIVNIGDASIAEIERKLKERGRRLKQ